MSSENAVFAIVIAALLILGAIAQLRVSNRIGDRGEVRAMVAVPMGVVTAILLLIPWGHPLFTVVAVLTGLAFMTALSIPTVALWGRIRHGDSKAGFRILFREERPDAVTVQGSASAEPLEENPSSHR